MDKYEQAYQVFIDCNKSATQASDFLGIPRTTLQSRVKKYLSSIQTNSEIAFPKIEDEDIPIESVINSLKERSAKRINNHDARKWMPFKVKTMLPIGICWFGDPHIDDNGCDWNLLSEHIDICKSTEGLYGANIGDTTNNWVGRLARLYAEQDTSERTAQRLTEWFFEESGVNWLIMLQGNHDNFKETAYLKKIAENVCPMIDWRAQFKLVFPNGRECLIDAAHNHNGHSQWNSLHGQQKAATMNGVANLYIAGHLHNWALAQNECPHTNRVYHLARCRGYKRIDSYAENIGFGNQKFGASIVTVIDPNANDVNLVRCFADVQEGAEYLTYLRSKYE